jgi:lipid II:glycine glycyltransferase (peptidoglycan interpeptide bridge formation enzyme)
LRPWLEREGYTHRPALPTYRTLLVDLSLEPDELLARATGKFRSNLRKAEKESLEIRVLKGADGPAAFRQLYDQMQRRKSFVDFSDITHLDEIQASLPADLELEFAVALHEDRPVAVQVTSLVGDTAVSLWAATNDEARRLRAGYRVSWWLVGYLKQRGLRFYDLGGLEEEGEAGVNTYKTSLAGKRGRDVRLVGKFDSWASPVSCATVRAGDALREGWQRARLVRRLLPARRGTKAAG